MQLVGQSVTILRIGWRPQFRLQKLSLRKSRLPEIISELSRKLTFFFLVLGNLGTGNNYVVKIVANDEMTSYANNQ